MEYAERNGPLVILLRGNSTPDPYVEAFEAAGFRAACVPVLQFEFPHQDVLRQHLAHPDGYGGLVFTSPRAVKAVGEALHGETELNAAWKAKSVFAVGPRTGAAAKALSLEPEGMETGNADALAAHIARTYDGQAPLLFLCSDRRRDTLPEGLTAAGVPFEEQIVYETHPRTDLDFSDRPSDRPVPEWLAFFSPSGIEAVQAAEGLVREAVRIAAIGPTTAAALEEAGWQVEAVAKNPTPEALVEAIEEGKKIGRYA